MKLLIKGYIIGIAKIIPGVSGALLAISLGVYDRGLKAITHFANDIKANIKFLFPLGVGIVLAIVTGSRAVLFLLNNAYVVTMFFFIGLIVGGLPSILSELSYNKRGYLILFLSFSIIILLGFINPQHTYSTYDNDTNLLIYILSGFIDALGTVVPGLSSTALLMLMGSYNVIMSALSTLDFFVLTYYGIGMIVGIISISLLVNFLFTHYKSYTFSFIFGIIIASTVLLIGKVIPKVKSINDIIICFPLFVLGLYISHKLD